MADAINNQFSTAYRFVFTAVRGDGRSIQLGEVRLYDSDGNAVAISSASNPDGDNPPAQRAANVIDGDLGTKPSSKWLDGRMSETGRSTLDLELASPAAAFTYEFWTANDVPWRDPIRWEVWRRPAGAANWVWLSDNAKDEPPWSRASTYGRLEVAPLMPPPPPAFPEPPAPPPLASPPPPYRWPPPPPPSPPPYPPPSFDLGGANSQALSESPSQTLAETSLAAQVTVIVLGGVVLLLVCLITCFVAYRIFRRSKPDGQNIPSAPTSPDPRSPPPSDPRAAANSAARAASDGLSLAVQRLDFGPGYNLAGAASSPNFFGAAAANAAAADGPPARPWQSCDVMPTCEPTFIEYGPNVPGAPVHVASHGCLTQSASQGRLPTAAMVAAEAALAPSPEWIEGGDPGQLRI